ncbi:MAG: hypothetical protein HN742_18770 [Lentisphaerae bacterium]|jgi:oligo-alginate lyase|nr:hypothetical protein [Lentisphaerota bacterium]MBT5605748.1 hypothetical protein [Lentisphaerota bacterium]MBT7053929.1 hypothetical protein [Lentisphaerota bacterium]MBT7843929.1 hypothetical protein [Lentisphaerota bacterium]
MKTRSILCAIAISALLAPGTHAAPGPAFRVINPAESPEQFRGAEGTAEAKVDEGAVVWNVPPGKTSFFPLFVADAGPDLGDFAGLAFWWRVKGDGLRSITIKTRCPSMHEGRQLVFPVWRKGKAAVPREWTPAQVSFAARGGIQGDPSDLRVIEFRTQTDRGSNVRLFVDHVVALAGTFQVRVATSRQDGDNWLAPITFSNPGNHDIVVNYGLGAATGNLLTLAAGQSIEKLVPIPIDREAFARLRPLASLATPLWAEQYGVELTRTRRMLHVLKPLPLPPHPRLLVDSDHVVKIKDRIRSHAWADTYWNKLRKKADHALERAIELPTRGGVAAHHYANPKTGGHLRAAKKIGPWEWEHIDRKTGAVFHGDPASFQTDLDGVKIGYVHAAWAREARDQAFVHQITGDAQYASRARDILLAYAETYLSYPRTRHGDPKTHGIGRATANYLTESTWVIDMAQATDMIWGRLSESERRRLADNVFYPALRDSIDPVRCYVHNIQCWKNSALGLVGLLYNDPELLNKALHDQAEGYWQQLKEGILPGGVWYEGSWGYHFYTMSALVPLTEACRHCGIDLYVPTLKSLYQAPLDFAMPDLRLPNFNDAGLIDLTRSSARYELAAARWDEPAFHAMLSYGKRATRDALLHGIPAAGGEPNVSARSVNHKDAGYAVLAKGEGENTTWLCLKYSPSAGYHDHPDRLGFILYARGKIVSPDPGSLSYGLDLQRDWYKTTLSHSTLMVDETSQERRPAKCLAFGTEGDIDYAMLDDGEAIPDVRFVRTAALLDQNLVVFVDQIVSDRERRLDLAYHQSGTWTQLPPGRPWTPPNNPVYRTLRTPTAHDGEGGITAGTCIDEDWNVTFTCAGGAPTEVITATGPGIGGAHAQVPCLVLRRRAKATALAWAIALDGQTPTLEWVDDASGKPRWQVARLRVSTPGRTPVLLNVKPDHGLKPFSIER